jgi:hypothetical protein
MRETSRENRTEKEKSRGQREARKIVAEARGLETVNR